MKGFGTMQRILFVCHGNTLTMGDVRKRQASLEAEHAEKGE